MPDASYWGAVGSSRRVAPVESLGAAGHTCGQVERSIVVLVSALRILASRQSLCQCCGISSLCCAMQC